MIRIKVLSAAVIPLFGVLMIEVVERWRRKSPPLPDAQTFKK